MMSVLYLLIGKAWKQVNNENNGVEFNRHFCTCSKWTFGIFGVFLVSRASELCRFGEWNFPQIFHFFVFSGVFFSRSSQVMVVV